MRTHFDKQLNKLNDELIEMGSMIEKAIEHTIKALVTQDIDLIPMSRSTVRKEILRVFA